MRAPTTKYKGPVPADIRQRVCAVVTSIGNLDRARAKVGVSLDTLYDLISPDGRVTAKLLARVRETLDGLDAEPRLEERGLDLQPMPTLRRGA